MSLYTYTSFYIMTMANIPIKLSDADVKKIDYLVKIGRYKSRNQAIRSLINKSLEQESFLFEEENPKFDSIKEKLYHIWDIKGIKLKFLEDGISLVDRVSKDRERF